MNPSRTTRTRPAELGLSSSTAPLAFRVTTRRDRRIPSVQEGLQQQHEGACGAGQQCLHAKPPAAEPDAVARVEADSGEEEDRGPQTAHDRGAELDTQDQQ